MPATPQITGPTMGDSGDEVSYWTDEETPFRLTVSYPANEDGVVVPETCRHCGNDVTREDESDAWESRTHGAECADNITDDQDEDGDWILGPHEVEESGALHPSR